MYKTLTEAYRCVSCSPAPPPDKTSGTDRGGRGRREAGGKVRGGRGGDWLRTSPRGPVMTGR